MRWLPIGVLTLANTSKTSTTYPATLGSWMQFSRRSPMRECAAREFGCDCTDHCQSYNAELERRIQNLGTVRKARPTPHNNTYFWAAAVICVALWGGFVAANGGFS